MKRLCRTNFYVSQFMLSLKSLQLIQSLISLSFLWVSAFLLFYCLEISASNHLSTCPYPPSEREQNYEALWKQVDAAVKASLPQTALQHIEQIYRKGIIEKNAPQVWKAYLWRMYTRQSISADSLYVDLNTLEQWVKRSKLPVERSILHILLADQYADYAFTHSYLLRQRTDISGPVSTDMREWTTSVFRDTIVAHAQAALQDPALLQSIHTRSLTPYLLQGSNSDAYEHDLYHVVAYRALKQWKKMAEQQLDDAALLRPLITQLYRQSIQLYKNRGLRRAVLLLRLDEAQWMYRFESRSSSAESRMQTYVQTLDTLLQEFSDEPLCAEVYLAKAQWHRSENQLTESVRLCDEAIRRYSSYSRINALKCLRRDITDSQFFVRMPDVVYPGQPMQVEVEYKNLQQITFHFQRDGRTVCSRSCCLTTVSPALSDYQLLSDYRQRDTVITFQAPSQIGKYQLKTTPALPDDTDHPTLYVSRLRLLTFSHPDQQQVIYVVDAESGHGVPGAQLRFYGPSNELEQQCTTDAQGRYLLTPSQKHPAGHFRYVRACLGADISMPVHLRYEHWTDSMEQRTSHHTLLLTDREVYRPGQTVYVKGIAYEQKKTSSVVLPRRQMEIRLMDSNYNKVAEQTVYTNEFGSFSTQFVLPPHSLNGFYQLSLPDGERTIRVESYKRPSFEVTFSDPQTSYRLGDSLHLRGQVQTFSGAVLAHTQVNYVVKQKVRRFYWEQDTRVMVTSTVLTDVKGCFEVPLFLEDHPDYRHSPECVYEYEVQATVTNVAGETQTSTYSLAVSRRSMNLFINLHQMEAAGTPLNTIHSATHTRTKANSYSASILRSEAEMRRDLPLVLEVQARNPKGQTVRTSGTWFLYKLKSLSSVKDREHEILQCQGHFEAQRPQTIDWSQLPSGEYRLLVKATDDQGWEVTDEIHFYLFSLADHQLSKQAPLWIYAEKETFSEDQPAVFYFGTSKSDAWIYLEAFTEYGIVRSEVKQLSNAVQRMQIPYQSSFGRYLKVNLCLVKEGRCFTKNCTFQKIEPSRRLTLCWSVFRDKLRPSSQEEWKLTVRQADGQPVSAEMLALMYDASLDPIAPYAPDFHIYTPRPYLYHDWNRWSEWNKLYLSYRQPNSGQYSYPGLYFDRFVVANGLFTPMVQRNVLMTTAGSRSLAAPKAMSDAVSNNGIVSKEKSLILQESVEEWMEGVVRESNISQDYAGRNRERENLVRKNLSETAFFYPHLQTNEQGEIVFSFTLPESLTRWHFHGFAHTADLKLGTLESLVVTQKELMLTPHLPRFVRVGDQTTFSALLNNLTVQRLTGKVSLELFDPFTERVLSRQTQSFAVAGGEHFGVHFPVEITDEHTLLGCRLIATADASSTASVAFSDGEQQVIPVLSNRMHVVETLSMPIRGEEIRTFSLESLFNGRSRTATHRRLTLEFTGNPAWYAVQSLPSLLNPVHEDALTWATTYYANTLAAHILHSQPRICEVFETWRLQGGTRETLLSQLEKNSELKTLLLQETPWMMQARDEREQQQRIGFLFDLNQLIHQQSQALQHLQELQMPDGSWAWFRGMSSSFPVTVYVLQLQARLALLTGQPLRAEARTMQERGLAYLHQWVDKLYREEQQQRKKGQQLPAYFRVPRAVLDYLYLIALTGESVPEVYQPAYQYYFNRVNALLETLPSMSSMEEKALGAIVLHRGGRSAEAQRFLRSLVEHLTYSDEQGMFFDFPSGSYCWGERPLPVHVRVMEALQLARREDTVSSVLSFVVEDKTWNVEQVIEEMKMWLLKQKQTQYWSSTVETADALYALLMNGVNLLDTRGDVRVELGPVVLETYSPTKNTDPVLGYVKQTYTEATDSRVVNQRRVHVEKRDAGVAWGAVYAEFDSPIRDLKSHGRELSVKKQLYVERRSSHGSAHSSAHHSFLKPLNSKTVLQVGDVVVSRLVLKTDRALEFVQLKEDRAACFEPLQQLSGYRWSNGLGFYIDTKDTSTRFFFDILPKGVYVLEYRYRVSRAGRYEAGVATLQCAYAPEFAAHSASQWLEVVPMQSID